MVRGADDLMCHEEGMCTDDQWGQHCHWAAPQLRRRRMADTNAAASPPPQSPSTPCAGWGHARAVLVVVRDSVSCSWGPCRAALPLAGWRATGGRREAAV